jgi:hypothetical protein
MKLKISKLLLEGALMFQAFRKDNLFHCSAPYAAGIAALPARRTATSSAPSDATV